MATIDVDGLDILIETDCFTATIATEGYTSGVKGGSFQDKQTGATDLGYGLDIADFLLEPADNGKQDSKHPYHSSNATHGNIPKRYVELPQICTHAKKLPFDIYRGKDFVAVKQWFRWTEATSDFDPGSLWEQFLVFPNGQRYFFSCDRITSANDSDALIFRLDLPGHLKHNQGQEFSDVYLSYHGKISSTEFLNDFPPHKRNLYRRNNTDFPERMIRAYRVRTESSNNPWLGGLTLNPSDVYEGWCHQRGYVCFIQELGGRPIKKGEIFGAAYIIGFFDSIEQMNEVYDFHKGHSGIEIEENNNSATWKLKEEP